MRLTLRLSFKQWSRAIDEDRLAAVRDWFLSSEEALARHSLAVQLAVDMAAYGIAAARYDAQGNPRRIDPGELFMTAPERDNWARRMFVEPVPIVPFPVPDATREILDMAVKVKRDIVDAFYRPVLNPRSMGTALETRLAIEANERRFPRKLRRK